MNDKDRQRLNEMLSAYIDGASDAPDEVERLIRTDAEAGRLYAQLSRLSAGLRALPAPDVHPAFATRVLAHVREERDAAAAPAWRHALPKVLALFAGVAMIAVAVWPFLPNDKGITTPTAQDPMVAKVLQLRNRPDTELAALYRQLAPENGSDAEPADASDNGLSFASDPMTDKDVSRLANRVAAVIGDSAPGDYDEDVFVAIDKLDASQAKVLRALLSDYAEGKNELL